MRGAAIVVAILEERLNSMKVQIINNVSKRGLDICRLRM